MKNNSQRHVYTLIALLFLAGFSLFFYRHWVLDVPLTDTENITAWTVEANLRFTADHNTPIKAGFTIPHFPPHFAIIDEYFISRNYGVTTSINGYNRETLWSVRRAHKLQSLYYRVILRSAQGNEPALGKPPAVKTSTLQENQITAINTITSQARQSSADIHTFAQSIIKALNRQDGNAKLLMGNTINEEVLVNTAILILNQAKVYAMPVRGLLLHQFAGKADMKLYLVVYNGKQWSYINPTTGSTGLPANFLVWQYGNEPIYNLQGGKNPVLTMTVSPTPLNALNIAKNRGLQADSNLLRFSLLQLPVHAQETWKILLTVPIGAFIILILRNFIGIKTFGTFMPVLIALAFRETHVIWGITLFVFIIAGGLLVRFYLDQLKLLLVPRLAAILTVVIALMIFISILCQNLGLESGLSVALFPMVILTMTIERMCITWDERGPWDAIKSGVGSLFAAVVAFQVMNNKTLEYLVFAFPELLLILLALILWFGQYRGYRLFELLRFKALAGTK